MEASLQGIAGISVRTLVMAAVCTAAAIEPGTAAETTGRGAFVGSTPVPYILDIATDPSEPGSVLLATRAGVYRAGQDGAVRRISRAANPVWSLSVGGVTGTRLFAHGIADDGRAMPVLVSDDRGFDWRGHPFAGQGPTSLRYIEASKASPGVVYAVANTVWGSVDGGSTWSSLGSPPGRILDLAASAIDARRIFAATLSDLHVSENGGITWEPIAATRCWRPVTAVDTGSDGAVYAYSLCAGLLRGDEVTGSWAVVNDAFGDCIVQHLAVDPADSARVYAVIRCHRVLVSADGGTTWRELGASGPWEPDCPTRPVGHVEPDE